MKTNKKIDLRFKIVECDYYDDTVWFTSFWGDYERVCEETIWSVFENIIQKYEIKGEIMFSYVLSERDNLTEKDLVEIDIRKQLMWKASASFESGNRYGYSSRTIMGYEVEENDFRVGGHSLVNELENNIWKYAYITLSYN